MDLYNTVEKYLAVLHGDDVTDSLVAELHWIAKQEKMSARRAFWMMKSAANERIWAVDAELKKELEEE